MPKAQTIAETTTPLQGASYTGYARIREIGPLGMISLRAKADVAGLSAAIKAATGCAVPAARMISTAGAKRAAWMSPDEYLLMVPYKDVGTALTAVSSALAGQHHLALDVSHARAVFAIEGQAQSVLSKLSPTDFSALAPNEMRRTRLAQVPAAFWVEGGNASVLCFASVAQYVFDILCHAATPGTEI
jgi:sarcosine oxidase subunit gamma